MPVAKPKTQAKKSAAPAEPERPVVYEDVQVNLLSGKDALTAQLAMQVLGWEEETDEIKFGDSYTLIDETGKKVRCVNNAKNRPLNEGWARTLMQDILMKRWAGPNGNGKTVNGEAVIIGRTGLVLSAQHRMIGLVLANQVWAGDQAEHWRDKWPTAPVLDTIMVCGVDESDETTMTLDNVRPRSLADVLYVGGYFSKKKDSERKVLVKMLENAVKLLWERTLQDQDAFTPRRTHSEALDFIGRHPRVVDAVKHVYEENGGADKRITKFVPGGLAAGLMYLMAFSGTEDKKVTKYKRADAPKEQMLDRSRWDKAEEFWTLLAGTAAELKGMREALGELPAKDADNVRAKMAQICKAWNHWVSGGSMTAKGLKLATKTDEDLGCEVVAEFTTVGGIDFGAAVEVEDDEPDLTDGTMEESAPAPAPRKKASSLTEADKKKARDAVKAAEMKARAEANGTHDEDAEPETVLAGSEGE